MKQIKMRKPIILGIVLVIFGLVLLGDHVNFYEYDKSIESMDLKLFRGEKTRIRNQMIWFDYEGNHIRLNTDVLLDTSKLKVFTTTSEGSEELKGQEEKKIAGNSNGSFLAIIPTMKIDINADGKKEQVTISAKTDTLLTQGFQSGNTQFRMESVPLELVLTEKSNITAYYKQEPLRNQELVISTNIKDQQKIKTDENGTIQGIRISEIRKGLQVTYINTGGEYYVTSYVVQDTGIFSSSFLEALMPILYILLFSFLIILGIVFVRFCQRKRKVYYLKRELLKTNCMGRKKEEKDTKARRKKRRVRVAGVKRKIPHISLKFSKIRWICMSLCFILFVYGFRLFGRWFRDIDLPVFACPKNSDQFVGSACYTLSHLNDFLYYSTVTEVVKYLCGVLIFVVIFGRTLCGFVCPFGFIQDLVHELRQKLHIDGVPFNEKIYEILKLIKWQLLLCFIGACFIGINFCNFCPAVITSPAFAGFKVSLYIGGFVTIIVLVGSFFKRRFWCVICPLGYLVGLLSKVSLFRLKKDCQACTECGACYEACPMGIKSIYTERLKKDITTNECIMCGECVRKCPENKAIAISFLRKKFYISSRYNFFEQKRAEKKK